MRCALDTCLCWRGSVTCIRIGKTAICCRKVRFLHLLDQYLLYNVTQILAAHVHSGLTPLINVCTAHLSADVTELVQALKISRPHGRDPPRCLDRQLAQPLWAAESLSQPLPPQPYTPVSAGGAEQRAGDSHQLSAAWRQRDEWCLTVAVLEQST